MTASEAADILTVTTSKQKNIALNGVVDAYLVAVDAFGRGSMRRREIERVTLNLRIFLEGCGIVEPMFNFQSAKTGRAGQ